MEFIKLRNVKEWYVSLCTFKYIEGHDHSNIDIFLNALLNFTLST